MKITLIICTYNNCDSLRRTLASLTRLAVPSGALLEVVVVDNNSSDNTCQVAEDFVERLPLRYIFEPEQGLAYARRRGVRESSSELIGFVDDDCVLAPDWIEQAVLFCEKHPWAGAVGGRVRPVYEIPPPDFLLRHPCMSAQDLGDFPQQMPSTGLTNLVGAGLLLRRSSLEATGWIERHFLVDHRGNSLSTAGDTEMVLRIRAAGYELWYNPAMRLDHCIPRSRISLSYVCRNFRGWGQASAIAIAMGNWQAPSRWNEITSGLGDLFRCTRALLRERWRKRQISPDAWIRFYTAVGRVEGALSLIWHKGLRLALCRELARKPVLFVQRHSRNGKSRQPLRLAIVGCGAITKMGHIPAASRTEEVSLVGLVDTDLAHVKALASHYGIPQATDRLEDLVGQIDAVILATPPHVRCELAMQALGLGLHVLCEKPLANSAAECQQMIAQAQAAGRTLAVAHTYRFSHNRAHARALFQSGQFGQLVSASIEEGDPFCWPTRTVYSLRKECVPGGVLFIVGLHTLDMLLWWFGPPRRMHYEDDSLGGLESNVRLTMEYDNGAHVYFRLSRTCSLSNRIEMRFANASIALPVYNTSEIELTPNGKEPSRLVLRKEPFEFVEAAAAQLRDFALAATEGRPTSIPAEAGLAVLDLIEACYRDKVGRPRPQQTPLPGMTW
jgi:predicted dehydrogenase/glycosyltransferase involved in cell wall biosynthesis